MSKEEVVMKSASELKAELDAKAPGRKKGPLYPFRTRAWICNITEQSHGPIYFDFGQFVVEGCREGEKYRMTLVTDRISRVDQGEKRTTELAVGALEIAHELARHINGDIGDDSFMGVFVCERAEPTKEELEGARERLRAYYERVVLVADDDFQRSRQSLLIPDFARRAAKALNLEKGYVQSSVRMEPCIGCGKPQREGIAMCGDCGAILDEAKARKIYPHLFVEQRTEEAKPKAK